MKINTCITEKSFESEKWKKAFKLLHEDLKLNSLPPKNDPLHLLLKIYWNSLWKEKRNIGKEFLNPSNMNIIGLRRIWEYTQTIASICDISNNNLKDKKIISLGAGIEPCLFAFSKLGAEVYASDIYHSPDYWHPDIVKYIDDKPEIFCHYKNFKPNIKYIDVDLRENNFTKNLEYFDIIYSVSSLEHIFITFRKKRKMFMRIIRHLKENGIFSFTTELIVSYDKTRNYQLYLKSLFKYFQSILTRRKFHSKKVSRRFNKFGDNSLERSLDSKKILSQIRILIKKILKIFHYNRRYDFFTIEELKKLVKSLAKKDVFLVQEIDLETSYEFTKKPKIPKGQIQNSISLTFKRMKNKEEL
jgi:SAM-dependent methyltransferase